MTLTLLIPELIWPEPADEATLRAPSTPNLSWLLGRAQAVTGPATAFESSLQALFPSPLPPLAKLRLMGEGAQPAPGSHYLCADPVHLRFHHERIVLADAGAFELSAEEADELIRDLNREFNAVGTFLKGTDRHWYLRLNQAVDHQVEPISQVAGRRMTGEINDHALPLTRWLNEVQMFLHLHPLNQARQQAGQPAINSLWLWGGGQLAEPFPSPWQTVYSDEPLTTGLAHWLNCPQRPLADLQPTASLSGDTLIVVDRLLSHVLYEDSEGWQQHLQSLDTQLFARIRKCLSEGVDRIDILSPTIYGLLRYSIPRHARWQFWKASPTLRELAQTLAKHAAP